MGSSLEQLSHELESSISGMSDEDLLRAPEGKWSVAEVLEHLRLTYTSTAKMLEKNHAQMVVERAALDERAKTARERILQQGRFFEGGQAPPFVTPKAPPDATVRTRVLEDLKRLDAALSEGEQRRGKDANQGNHFALGPLTGDEWRQFHLVHGRHHAKQIEKLRAWAATA